MQALCVDLKTKATHKFTVAVDPKYKEIIDKELKRMKIWMACKMVLKEYAERGIIQPVPNFPYHEYTNPYEYKFADGSTHEEIINRSRDILVKLI